jgi:hypothetical protein
VANFHEPLGDGGPHSADAGDADLHEASSLLRRTRLGTVIMGPRIGQCGPLRVVCSQDAPC